MCLDGTMICGPFDRQPAASVIKCLDDLVQPHLNEKDGILVLAHVRGHVQEGGRTNFRKGYLRYLNLTTF